MLTRRDLLSKVATGLFLSSVMACSVVLCGCAEKGSANAEDDVDGSWYGVCSDSRLMLDIDGDKWVIYSDPVSMHSDPSGKVIFKGEGYVDKQPDGSYLFTCETKPIMRSNYWREEALVKLREGKYLIFQDGILFYTGQIRFCRDKSVWYSKD